MFRRLLIPIDGSPLAEQAIGRAASIARAAGATLDMVLVHERSHASALGTRPEHEQSCAEHHYLEELATEVASGAGVKVAHEVLRGDAVEMLCRHARQTQADLVVMTTHGRTGLSRAWLGSVADGMLRRSAIPVFMLRPMKGRIDRLAAHRPLARILVPLDGSTHAMEVLPLAAALARCSAARMTLVRVVPPVPLLLVDEGTAFVYPPVARDEMATAHLVAEAERQTAEAARGLAEQGIEVESRVVVAEVVAQAIVHFARAHQMDAIAMSTHGRGASRLLLGNVADKVLRASGIPVLLHRPPAVRASFRPVVGAAVAEQLSILPRN